MEELLILEWRNSLLLTTLKTKGAGLAFSVTGGDLWRRRQSSRNGLGLRKSGTPSVEIPEREHGSY